MVSYHQVSGKGTRAWWVLVAQLPALATKLHSSPLVISVSIYGAALLAILYRVKGLEDFIFLIMAFITVRWRLVRTKSVSILRMRQ